MEELRSTEVLDREILEDARKKAFKILKTADDTIAAQKQDWDRKTQEAVDSLRNYYSERIKKTGNEVFARFPLDKRRLRSETSEAFLIKAMASHLDTLARETMLSILTLELSERLDVCAADLEGEKLELLFSGMSASEARQVLYGAAKTFAKDGPSSSYSAPFNTSAFQEAALNKAALKEAVQPVPENEKYSAIHGFPSIVINTDPLKITASIESAAAGLLKKKRAELASALLGEEVLDD